MSSAVMSLSIWCGNGVRKVKAQIPRVEKIPFDMVAAFELKMERLLYLFISKRMGQCKILSSVLMTIP